MLRQILSYFTLPCFCFSAADQDNRDKARKQTTGTLEKMIVASGSVTMDVDLNRLNGVAPRRKNRSWTRCGSKWAQIRFSRFWSLTMLLRGPEPGSMGLIPKKLRESSGALKGLLKPTGHRETPMRMNRLTLWFATGKRDLSFSTLKECL